MPSSGIDGRLNGHDMEQVRVEFTHYYLEENKQLPEIMEIFKERGIDATKQQWKTQITRWNISKNNKKSDMVFAANKMNSRKRSHGKDTVFEINGRTRTAAEVAHYFKRRRPNPEEVLLEVDTPEGISYFTPSAASPDTTVPHGVELISAPATPHDYLFLDADTSTADTHLNDTTLTLKAHDTAGKRSLCSTQYDLSSVTPRIGLCRSPRTLGALRAFELGLLANRAFYDQTHLPKTSDTVRQAFFDNINICISHFNIGNLGTAQSFWDRSMNNFLFLLPDLRSLQLVLPFIIVITTSFADTRVLKYRYLLLKSIRRISIGSLPQNHPFLTVMQSFYVLYEHSGYTAERFLLQMIETLSRSLPHSIHMWVIFNHELIFLLSAKEKWHSVINHSASVLQTLQQYYEIEQDMVFWELCCLQACIDAHTQIESFSIALGLLESLSKKLHHAPDYKGFLTVRFYRLKGELRRRQNDPYAIQDLESALELSRKYFGVEGTLTVDCYTHLQVAISGGRPVSLI